MQMNRDSFAFSFTLLFAHTHKYTTQLKELVFTEIPYGD